MKKPNLFFACLFLLFLLTGCGKQEINDLAMVMAVGLDKEKESGNVKLTAQIVRPADARGQTGAPSGGTGEAIWTATSEGKSIFEAIRNLGRYSSRRVYWAHNKVIVINEEVAKDSIVDIIDFFTRNVELRMNTWVVVTPEKASQLVATKTGMEVVPGDSIDKLFRYNQIVSESPRTDMRTLTAAYLSKESHPVLAIVKIKERGLTAEDSGEFGSDPQVELSGTAIFKKEKMVGRINAKESRGLLWFISKPDSGVIALACSSNEKEPISLEIKKSNLDVTPLYRHGQVKFDVRLNVELNLVELGCPTDMENPEIMEILEKQAKTKLESELNSVIEKAQKKYRVDFLHLGKTFQNRYPGEWRKLSDNWEDIFPEAEVDIHVAAQIRSPVLLENPTRPLK